MAIPLNFKPAPHTASGKLSPETRAVQMAAADVSDYVDSLGAQARFMGAKRSQVRDNVYGQIARSPLASQLLTEGYPVDFVSRVADIEGGKE